MSKLITKYIITDASLHDSQQMEPSEEKDKEEHFRQIQSIRSESRACDSFDRNGKSSQRERFINSPLTEGKQQDKIKSTLKSRTHLCFYRNEHERNLFVKYRHKNNHNHSRVN